MTVQQIDDQSQPAYLTVYFDKDVAVNEPNGKKLKDAAAPPPQEKEQYRSLDVRHLQVADIWGQFKRLTGARNATILEKQEQKSR